MIGTWQGARARRPGLNPHTPLFGLFAVALLAGARSATAQRLAGGAPQRAQSLTTAIVQGVVCSGPNYSLERFDGELSPLACCGLPAAGVSITASTRDGRRRTDVTNASGRFSLGRMRTDDLRTASLSLEGPLYSGFSGVALGDVPELEWPPPTILQVRIDLLDISGFVDCLATCPEESGGQACPGIDVPDEMSSACALAASCRRYLDLLFLEGVDSSTWSVARADGRLTVVALTDEWNSLTRAEVRDLRRLANDSAGRIDVVIVGSPDWQAPAKLHRDPFRGLHFATARPLLREALAVHSPDVSMPLVVVVREDRRLLGANLRGVSISARARAIAACAAADNPGRSQAQSLGAADGSQLR